MKRILAILLGLLVQAPIVASFLSQDDNPSAFHSFSDSTIENKMVTSQNNNIDGVEKNLVRSARYRRRYRRRSIYNLWPFRMSSSADGVGGGKNTGGQHLIRAGQELHVAAKSVGPSNYACPNLMRDAGDSISEIGEYWTESWEAVTYAAEDASSIFHSLSQLQSHPELAKIYSASSGELRQIASIVGCTSVGPPSAVPNLLGLAEKLKQAAVYVEKCGEECSEDSRAFGKSLKNASKSIRALAKEYQ